MLFGIYSVYDRVSGMFSAPFIEVNNGAAVRHFKLQLNNVVKTDYDLCRVGTFDSKSGQICSENVTIIVNGGDLDE